MYERAVVRHSRFYRANRQCGIRRRCAVPDDSGDGRAAADRRRGRRRIAAARGPLDGGRQARFGLLLGIAAVDLLFPHLPRIAMLLAAFYLICAAFMLHVFEFQPDAQTETSARARAWRRVGQSAGGLCAMWAIALAAGVA